MASADKGLEEIPEGEHLILSAMSTPPLMAWSENKNEEADENFSGRSNRVQL
jgi:hypothetical protein